MSNFSIKLSLNRSRASNEITKYNPIRKGISKKGQIISSRYCELTTRISKSVHTADCNTIHLHYSSIPLYSCANAFRETDCILFLPLFTYASDYGIGKTFKIRKYTFGIAHRIKKIGHNEALETALK